MKNDKYIYLNIKDMSLTKVLEMLANMSYKDYGAIDLNKILEDVKLKSINALTINLLDKSVRGSLFTDLTLRQVCVTYEDFFEKYLKNPTSDLHTLIKKILYDIQGN